MCYRNSSRSDNSCQLHDAVASLLCPNFIFLSVRLGHNDVAFLHRGIAITHDRTIHAGLLKYFKMTYQPFFFFVESDNKQRNISFTLN